MAERNVIWTRTSQSQRRAVLKYWVLKNGSTAYSEKLIELITKRVAVLLIYPESFPQTIYPNTRVSAMGHFSIFFKHSDNKIIITAFWDNRQDPNKLKKLLPDINI